MLEAKQLAETYARKVLEVVKVVDGDTLHARLDLGYYTHQTVKLRLRGIDAPETNRGRLRQQGLTDEAEIEEHVAAGKAAKDFLASLLTGELYVITYKYQTEKYGRYLADLYTADGVLINKLMVDAGHAVAFQ
jgi:endonuclease YncB( thermonuclease family)